MADFANAKRDAGLVQARTAVSRIIGVDRLDYTKGLPQKFKAFGRFLEKYPQYQRQVVLTQIAPPTRESVEAYSDIRQQLESAGRLRSTAASASSTGCRSTTSIAPRRGGGLPASIAPRASAW